ncbi:hypothetical protein [Ectopseudomonas composti]|uniref:YkvI family membrane protein n=1 Tax=Ectopseudomonas composti TaxID=658457 RepID=UPI00077463EA|nr:hypothetical protein [Pseudomonas composti]
MRVLLTGGALIALLVGSGFTTGQEIMQYFVAYGYRGVASVALMLLLFIYVNFSFVSAGYEQQFSEPKSIYQYYCGKLLGSFFDYFSVVFLFMSFWVMIAGAGAALHQQFGWPNWIGGVAMGSLALVTLLLGFKRLVEIIGLIGPLLSVLAIVIGIVSYAMAPDGLQNYAEQLEPLVTDRTVLQASSNWFIACASYVGFCMMWLAAFMTNLGKSASSRKEARWGATLGAVMFSLAVLAMMLGLAAHLDDVAGTQIPTLALIAKLHPTLALGFALIVFVAIFTTAAPLLWAPVKRFAPDENSQRHRILLVVLAVIGTLVGLTIPFDRLINIVYVINGYVGFALLFLMLAKDIRTRLFKSEAATVLHP